MRNDADPPPRPTRPRRADRAGGGAARGRPVWLLIAALALGPVGCTTAQMNTPPSVDALERIPPGTRVRITTREGDTLSIKITEATDAAVAGRDRYFRQHEVSREQIEDIDAPPQNDWVVALLFFVLVFVART
jgi:hypothetical protein